MKQLIHGALAAASVMGFLSGITHASPVYTILVTFDGPGDNAGGTTVNGVSNNGAIVGFSSNANQTVLTNFVRNTNGTFTPLNINNDPLANANGINSGGTVVGTTNGQGFSLSNGLLTTLSATVPGSTASEVAFGINDGGTIVGQFVSNATDTTPGFVDQSGKFTILNTVANAVVTNAQGINNQGLVTGFYSTDEQHQHGFFFDVKTDRFSLPADPVQPNLFLTQFLGINDNGFAAGYWQDIAGDQHGFIYDTNTKTYTFLDDPNAGHNNGLAITQITGINDSNEIVGFYVDPNGLQRGFYTTAAPEPAAWLLGAIGMAGIFVRKKWLG